MEFAIFAKGFIALLIILVYSFIVAILKFGENITWKEYFKLWFGIPVVILSLGAVIYNLGALVDHFIW